MGYRMDVEVVKNIGVQATKLYGYYDKELKSAKFLQEKGYCEDARLLQNPWQMPILLVRVYDFREFAKLYNEELNMVWGKYEEKDWWINQDAIQEILKMPNSAQVVLSWG